MWNSSIWLIDRTISGATTPSQSGLGSDVNEGVLCISQSFSITEALQSDYLVSYPGHSLGWFYSSTEIQSVYSEAPAEWANFYMFFYFRAFIKYSFFWYYTCFQLQQACFYTFLQLLSAYFFTLLRFMHLALTQDI